MSPREVNNKQGQLREALPFSRNKDKKTQGPFLRLLTPFLFRVGQTRQGNTINKRELGPLLLLLSLCVGVLLLYVVVVLRR